ncbi:MAG: NAD(P)H-hydrate dehydratase, partial [Chitinophagaceae bacterium]|nr:NAD(P)H-hydrate dehydratase [Chitinophagaceae bacterium]
IGLSDKFIESTQTNYHIVGERLIKGLYKIRESFSHKGNYGMAYIVAGSHGMMGAAVLTVKAALRAGAGKVKALIPECGYTVMQTAVPEAMCAVSGETYVSRVKGWEEADAVGIGPGLKTAQHTGGAFADFITACKDPIVIDADGLNLLAEQPDLIHKIPANSVLTPHPKEFERLFGKTKDSMQQLELARTQSMKYNLNIVLKGHHTVVVNTEGDCWYNLTGNAGMATAGSGDVLTGVITGLMAQGFKPTNAAILGVYLHGLAGDYAAADLSQYSVIAGDIVDNLGRAFKYIRSQL